MQKILYHIIDWFGPITIAIFFYMGLYLLSKKAFPFSQLFIFTFWPQLIFRYRDFTKAQSGRISVIYYLFFFCITLCILAIIGTLIPELKDMPIPAIAFVGLAVLLFLPIVIYIFFLMSKENYY